MAGGFVYAVHVRQLGGESPLPTWWRWRIAGLGVQGKGTFHRMSRRIQTYPCECRRF